MHTIPDPRLDIAVIGTGISGMAAAWLLSQRHRVTVYERAERPGGHSNTVEAEVDGVKLPVDIGFIVYNEINYPNLTALFKLLKVPTKPADMSFGVSLDGGRLEYSGTSLRGLFAQRRNLINGRFWSMLRDLVRFYREAPAHLGVLDESTTLGDYLDANGYGTAFQDDHLLPMGGAIWSSTPRELREFPALSFIRFHDNHGLLQFRDRPQWRTVDGGSRRYVSALTERYADRIGINNAARGIVRHADGVAVRDSSGEVRQFDHVVLATHADQALALLGDPTPAEQELLGAFRYTRNLAVLHTDARFMPKRRTAWASWNYMSGIGGDDDKSLCVTYWMSHLQSLGTRTPIFLTLNPPTPPRAGTLLHTELYEHPLFDAAAVAAQRRLWSLQGAQRTWFCGAHFGAGFHEDGLQAGLAVAEQLGGVRRPWRVDNESGRITLAAGPVTHAEQVG